MRVPVMLSTLVVCLLSGCTSPEPDAVTSVQEPATVPDEFHKAYAAGAANVAVGGVVLSHAFVLETDATLHAYSRWSLPEPLVDVELRRGTDVVFAESFPAQESGGWQEEIPLHPGGYELVVRVYGVGAMKDFSLGGSFEPA